MAAESWGILTAGELHACGFTDNAIGTRKRIGWLHRLHRGVYALGHANPPWEGTLVAAVKACGPNAVLSHWSAGELWKIVDRLGRLPDVTVIGSGTRRHRGIRVHRAATIPLEHRRIEHGIPVTSVAWTLLDLAATLKSLRRLRAAIRRAIGLGIVTLGQLALLLAQCPGRRGAGRLRAAIARGAIPTNSDKESQVFDLIVAGGFVPPDVNKPLIIGGRRIVPDFRWPEARLVLELDSDAWHSDPLARADDAERQAVLEAHGETVLRAHWLDAVVHLGRLHAQLAEAGAPRATEGRLPTASR